MLGLNRTGHMSFLTRQDWTPKFAGQVLPDQSKSGLYFKNVYKLRIIDFWGYYQSLNYADGFTGL